MKKSLVVMALVLVCAMLLPCFVSAVNFTKEADALNDMGLFLGTNNGYDLDKKPTRAQAAVMLVRFLGKVDEALELEWTAPFTDVPDWAKPYVQYLYNAGLTVGYSETIYAPDDDCSAQMYATFMLRALGYMDINPDDYKPKDDEPVEDPAEEGVDEFDHIEFVDHTTWDSIYRIPLAMYENIPTFEDGSVDLDNVNVILSNGVGTFPASQWVEFVKTEAERHEEPDAEWVWTLSAEDKDGDGTKEHYITLAYSGLFGCPEHGGWTNETSEKLEFTGKDGKDYSYDFRMIVDWPWNGSSASEDEDTVELTAAPEFVPAFTYAEAIEFATEKALITEVNCDTENFLRDHMVAIAYTALGIALNGTEQKLIEKLAEEGVVTAEQVEKYLNDEYLAGGDEPAPEEPGVDEFDRIEFAYNEGGDIIYRIPVAMYDSLVSKEDNGVRMVDISTVSIVFATGEEFPYTYWETWLPSEAAQGYGGHAPEAVDIVMSIILFEKDRDGDGINEHYMNMVGNGYFACPAHGGWTDGNCNVFKWVGNDGKTYSMDWYNVVEVLEW